MGSKTLKDFFGDRQIKKILVFQLGGIGDLVISSTALKALRAEYKDAYIALAVITRAKELMSGSPYINEIFVFDTRDTKIISLFAQRRWSNVFRTIKRLRGERFDVLINLETVSTWKGAFKMAMLTNLISVKATLGRNTHGKGFFWDIKIEENSAHPLHEVDCIAKIMEAAGAPIGTASLELPVFEEDRAFVLDFLRRAGIQENDRLIGFNPGAFRPSRKWPRQYWVDLAKSIIKECGCKIIITSHSSEQKESEEIIKAVGSEHIIAVYNFNLKQVSALIEKMRLFITNDSGPMHIASAMHTPVIGLFGPGDHRRFCPYPPNAQNIVIRNEASCVWPCYKSVCKDNRCMKLITVEDVFRVAGRILSAC
jgi:lipopolysaccharide heptosyltransferase II